MEKKKLGILSGGVLVVALVAMIGIVYAAYSQTLNINGDATVKANSWKIKFANLSAAKITGEAKEITAPTINNNDTTIGDYSVILSKPGDKIEYTFDIVNEGTFDAHTDTSNISWLRPTCTGTGENAEEDARNVCKYLNYEFRYNGDDIIYYDGAVLAGETDGKISLVLSYNSAVPASELPKNDVVISGLNTSLVFSQCSGDSCGFKVGGGNEDPSA